MGWDPHVQRIQFPQNHFLPGCQTFVLCSWSRQCQCSSKGQSGSLAIFTPVSNPKNLTRTFKNPQNLVKLSSEEPRVKTLHFPPVVLCDLEPAIPLQVQPGQAPPEVNKVSENQENLLPLWKFLFQYIFTSLIPNIERK